MAKGRSGNATPNAAAGNSGTEQFVSDLIPTAPVGNQPAADVVLAGALGGVGRPSAPPALPVQATGEAGDHAQVPDDLGLEHAGHLVVDLVGVPHLPDAASHNPVFGFDA